MSSYRPLYPNALGFVVNTDGVVVVQSYVAKAKSRDASEPGCLLTQGAKLQKCIRQTSEPRLYFLMFRLLKLLVPLLVLKPPAS